MPRSGTKHQPVLYSHPESGEIEGDENSLAQHDLQPTHTQSSPWAPRAQPPLHTHSTGPLTPGPSSSSSSTSSLRSRARPRPQHSYALPPPIAGSVAQGSSLANGSMPGRGPDVYTTFTRKYRPDSAAPGYNYHDDGSGYDPDQNYFSRGLGQLNDADSEDDGTIVPTNSRNGPFPETEDEEPIDIESLQKEERERLEWQSMLASVLDGEVFRSEKTRIVRALETVEARNNTRQEIWVGIRAWLRGRTDEQETAKLEERRLRIVDSVVEEVLAFRVQHEPDPATGDPPPSPAEQVDHILDRFDVATTLYPSIRAMQEDKPSCAREDFRDRLDTLISWSKLHKALNRQIRTLQLWTGSEILDVTQPNTTMEPPLLGGQDKDTSTFVERVLKEDSLQQTFEKGALVTIHFLIESARRVVTSRGPLFEELGLPSFENELVKLISFPTKLIEASLRVRLDAAQRVTNPNTIIVDTMADDFKLSIALGCTLKREYEALMAEDAEGNWTLPPCIPKEYDQVLLQSILVFFKLLYWKLKSGQKGIYFKETDVLESQNDILEEFSMTVEGGAALIAEQLCALTNRLIYRVVNYFETQMEVSVATKAVRRRRIPDSPPRSKSGREDVRQFRQRMEDAEIEGEDVVMWLGKVLESVRLRYRKLQRYARSITTRFTNSAEYAIKPYEIKAFLHRLIKTDHFLIYTDSLEEDGIYMFASSTLRDRPALVRDMLLKAYNIVKRDKADVAGYSATSASGESSDDGYIPNIRVDYNDPAAYLLLFSPGEKFFWGGLVMMLSLPRVPLAIDAERVRLVADGDMQIRLPMAKQAFVDNMTVTSEEAGEPLVEAELDAGPDETTAFPAGEPLLELPCVVPFQSHLPSVQREIRKIQKATNKLAEVIVESVHTVRGSLIGAEGYQELLQNWYTFASDHGNNAQRHMEPGMFQRLLTKLAISWVAFICDDCDPTERKTFRWAVTALEFAMARTHGRNILTLPDDEFALLRQKVASCMTLLISHFDILGARGSFEASKEQERLAELRQMQKNMDRIANEGTSDRPTTPITEAELENKRLRLRWEEPLRKVQELDQRRTEIGVNQATVGRVIDEEKLEDKSLLFLASSTSNISIRWQQGRFIGAGAFGSVYLATNLDSGGLMAAKEIKFQDTHSLPNLYQQIKDELNVMEILQHPNIVEYYGIEVHRDKVFIFEEYCQGGSLAALLEYGRIEDETVLQVYTMQMLDGLAYLHSKGVVHRDIKPDNILLDHLGVIKYVDFGASKIIAQGQRSMQRSRNHSTKPVADPSGLPPGVFENSLTGTPMYMSPEVIKSDRRGRQGAMDIWSLGCVVLECATGRKPWSNLDNEWAIMFTIATAKMPPLPEPGQLSDLGINFIKQCLTVDPMLRPTANDLLNHPWMLAFRTEMLEYEQMQNGGEVRPATPNGGPEATDLSRQAALLAESQLLSP